MVDVITSSRDGLEGLTSKKREKEPVSTFPFEKITTKTHSEDKALYTDV